MDTTLVIMAAGMGSRFGGGVKQLQPLGPNGETLMEYSIYDALNAGFNKVVFITRKELYDRFEEMVASKVRKKCPVEYVFQEITSLPEGYECSEERKKPWGTGQAILEAKKVVNEPFLVINADDYYGRKAFSYIQNYLSAPKNDTGKFDFCMAGFILGNTLSDNGAVTRGVCSIDKDGNLIGVDETEGIIKKDGEVVCERDGEVVCISADSKVSMNMWGFTPEIFDVLDTGFKDFLDENGADSLKGEYLIPSVVDELIKEGKAAVAVLETDDKWFGITYQEDIKDVENTLKALVNDGVYPADLYAE